MRAASRSRRLRLRAVRARGFAAHPQPAQDYPNRAVTIVAPAAPGGLYSLFARLIGSKLEQRLGKPFVVENRPGASSIVGATSVIRAPHDGYTLMVANTSGLATNVSLHKNSALRSGQGFRADRVDRAHPRGAGGQRRAAGAFAGRSRQAREERRPAA